MRSLRSARLTAVSRFIVSAALVAALGNGATACGRGREGTNEDPCASAALALTLQPLGFSSLQGYPGDSLTLKVAALSTKGKCIDAEADLTPAPGEAVSWRILGSPAGAPQLSALAVSTNAEGVAEVVLTTGSTSGATLQVEAAASGAAPVVFSVVVRADSRELQFLSPAVLDSAVDRSERVRVRLIRPSPAGPGTPIAGEDIEVALVGGARNGARLEDDPADVQWATTDGAGVATFRFLTGTVASISYDLTFCGQGHCPGIPSKTLTVNVAARASQNGACQYFTDCAAGLICDNGECKPADVYCDADADCPTGYRCNSTARQCELDTGGPVCDDPSDCAADETCGAAGTCIDDGGCLDSGDCPPGWTCDTTSGACVPPSNTPALDVRGRWDTRYHFDISDTLPGFFTDGLGPVVSFLNLVFHSQIDIDIPILGDILEALIDQLIAEYVPPWVQIIVAVLDDMIQLFEDVEAEGEMFLSQSPTSPVLGANVAGEEDWTSAQFFVVSLCPGGPAAFAQNPACGAVDVVMTPTASLSYSNNDPTVGVRVKPFTGRVEGEDLRLYDREVDIEMRQLVNVLLDIIVTVASGGAWYDFEEFLVDIVPCTDLQYAIDDLACDITDGSVCQIPGIEALCEAAASAATMALTQALGEIGVALELDFDARARLHDNTGDGRVDILGSPTNPTDNNESSLAGGSTDVLLFDGELDSDSWWYGKR